jgi:hypothetical protein
MIREEDTAYPLLGIFDVYMPLIYEEKRERVFIRLQEDTLMTENRNRTSSQYNDLAKGVSF